MAFEKLISIRQNVNGMILGILFPFLPSNTKKTQIIKEKNEFWKMVLLKILLMSYHRGRSSTKTVSTYYDRIFKLLNKAFHEVLF